MATERRRRALATASTGAVLTTAGGVLRHKGIDAAHEGKGLPSFSIKHPVKTHPTRALLRAGAKGRKRYALGATLGLVGAPAFAVGAHDYVTSKRDRHPSFVHEGLTGTRQALEQRAAGMKEVPPQHRAGPIAVAAATGGGGSQVAHMIMNRARYFQGTHRGGRAGISALAGTAAAAASLPLARRTVRSNDYEVTPTGVRRRKRAAVRPSAKGKVVDQKRMSRSQFRQATVGTTSKVHNPHNLKPTTSRGTPRKVHWEHHEGGKSVCGLDGAFGHGNGPFAENYGEVSCRGCKRMLRITKGWSDDRADHPTEVEHPLTDDEVKEHLRRDHRWGSAAHRDRLHESGELRATHDVLHRFPSRLVPNTHIHVMRIIGKASSDYLGRRTSFATQRAKTMAAGSVPGPFVGPLAAARQSGKYAPPGQKRQAEGRQLASSAATTATGVGGAYLAASNRKVGEHAVRGHEAVQRATRRVTGPVRSRVHLKAPGGHRIAQTKARGVERATRTMDRSNTVRRAVGPLRRNKVAAAAGFVAGSKLSGQVYGNLAISRNQAAQTRYNLKHPQTGTASKADAVKLPTRAEQRRRLDRKRRATTTQILTSSLGLAGAAAGTALLPGVRGRLKPTTAEHIQRAAIGTGLAAGGVSGVHGIRSARLQRKELREQQAQLGTKAARLSKALSVAERLQELHKADKQPLTRMRSDQAHQIVRRYGDAGPLPKELSREDRMRAYEARYVHAGGHKAERYQRRADIGDKIKTGGLAGATAGGVGILALRHPKVAARLGHRAETARHAADTATIGAATASGVGELYAGHARRRRSSYSNSKAGVAASALRRMRDYSS